MFGDYVDEIYPIQLQCWSPRECWQSIEKLSDITNIYDINYNLEYFDNVTFREHFRVCLFYKLDLFRYKITCDSIINLLWNNPVPHANKFENFVTFVMLLKIFCKIDWHQRFDILQLYVPFIHVFEFLQKPLRGVCFMRIK
jgi:hypothetical protein